MEDYAGIKNDKKNNKKRKVAWITVIAINIIIAVMVSCVSINYFLKQSNYRYEMAEKSFASTMSSMGQVAYGYLHTEQTFCDDWATYINLRFGEIDLDTAAEFVKNVNTDNQISSHIIYYDTLEGIAIDEGNVESISYKDIEPEIDNAFEMAKTCHMENSHLHITSPFKNPYDGVLSVGFCHNLRLVDSSGKEENAALVRVVPVTKFKGKWLFPTGYENAKLALIDEKGEFIVRFDGVEQTNFFDYIDYYNQLDDEALAEVENTILTTDEGTLRYLNKDGQDSCYSYKRLEPFEG